MRKLLAGLLTTSILTVSVFGSSIYAKDNYKQAYTKFFNRESINWGGYRMLQWMRLSFHLWI